MAFSRPPVTPANAVFGPLGNAAWAAGYGVAGADVGGIPYCPTATSEITESTFTWKAATGQGLIAGAGTATTDVALATFSRTNNNAAVTKGFQIVYTDTTSAAGFLPFQILGTSSGTQELFSLSKTGLVTAGGTNTTNLVYTFTSDPDTGIGQAAANEVHYRTAGAAKILFGRETDERVLQMTSLWTFAWESGTGSVSQAVADTSLCRVAAGKVGVSTSGAVGSAGTMRAKFESSDGTAGANFGPGLPTSITVKDGIVTAIS